MEVGSNPARARQEEERKSVIGQRRRAKTVRELIELLKQEDPDMELASLWDEGGSYNLGAG